MIKSLSTPALILAVAVLICACSKDQPLREVESEDLVGVAASARFAGSWCYVDQENESVVTLVLGADRSAFLHLSGLGADTTPEILEGTWSQVGNRVDVSLEGGNLTVEEVEDGAVRVSGIQSVAVQIVNSPTLHRQHP